MRREYSISGDTFAGASLPRRCAWAKVHLVMRSPALLLLTLSCALLFAGCNCGTVAHATCGTATDCGGGELCLNGVCTPPDGGTAEDAGAADAGARDGGVDAGVDAGTCGDGTVEAPETCDDHNAQAGDGCSATCTVEQGFSCPTAGQPCVVQVVCGDGRLGGIEGCDDHNTTPGDGCSATCALEPGWACPTIGVACVAARCGDGLIAGLEECDDGNATSGDGCSATCVVEDGWACSAAGQPCARTTCGNHVVEGTEQCDDGNNNLGDGCDPFCHAEPVCANGTCTATCGDGIRLPGEACDDGNTRAGDGCSPTCTIEHGFQCADSQSSSQTSIDIPIVYRDFLPFGSSGGHADFDNANGDDRGIVTTSLGADKKPVYAGGSPTTHGQTAFDQWYRDTVGVNRTVADHLTVTQSSAGIYVFDSDAFFPLDGRGWQSDGTEPSRYGHNFSFTSELHYWFTWAGGEQLQFRGDDDVWVFINGQLAVNLGGVHGPEDGATTLDVATGASLGLTAGGIYEAAVFQAERHVTGSSYKLTLKGFNATKSSCTWTCGDGIVTRYEACDDGINDGRYGGCMPGCRAWAPFCGDGHVDPQGGEVCDDGANTGAYGTCSPGCKSVPRCGDGFVQQAAGETCDDGNTVNGDGCDSSCHIELG
jgi:fibro-slime domain-containing protein